MGKLFLVACNSKTKMPNRPKQMPKSHRAHRREEKREKRVKRRDRRERREWRSGVVGEIEPMGIRETFAKEKIEEKRP